MCPETIGYPFRHVSFLVIFRARPDCLGLSLQKWRRAGISDPFLGVLKSRVPMTGGSQWEQGRHSMQVKQACPSDGHMSNLKGGSRRGGENKSWVSVGAGRELQIYSMYREDATVWPAGQLLVRLLVEDKDILDTICASPSLIVEVGTGTGLVSLGVASARMSAELQGGGEIVATDGSKTALKHVRKNAAENGMLGKVKIEEWDWRAPIPWWGKRATVLLGSDVVYGDTSPQAAYLHLSRGISEAMSIKPGTGEEGRGRDGVVGYFCNRVRSDCFEGSSVELFEKDLIRRGLVVEPIPPTPEATQGFDEAEIEKMRFIKVTPPACEGLLVDFSPGPGFSAEIEVDEELLQWAGMH